jgi:hypothetical protein
MGKKTKKKIGSICSKGIKFVDIKWILCYIEKAFKETLLNVHSIFSVHFCLDAVFQPKEGNILYIFVSIKHT